MGLDTHLDRLADQMELVADLMASVPDGELPNTSRDVLLQHAEQMRGAAVMARDWAFEIWAENDA